MKPWHLKPALKENPLDYSGLLCYSFEKAGSDFKVTPHFYTRLSSNLWKQNNETPGFYAAAGNGSDVMPNLQQWQQVVSKPDLKY